MGYLMKNNKPIIVDGTLIEVPTQQTKTVELSMASGNQTISPDSGKVLSKVTVTKPSTLISANIKKDVVIGGVTGALEEGVESETWVINESPVTSSMHVNVSIPFVSKETSYSRIIVFTQINYDNSRAYDWANEIWIDPAYRKITFLEPPTGNLLTWLQANAVKQPSDQAIQTDKSLTVTSNGTVSVIPDEPYDAMSKVDLTVNGTGGETIRVDIYPITLNDYTAGFGDYTVLKRPLSGGEDQQLMHLSGVPYPGSQFASVFFVGYFSPGDYLVFPNPLSYAYALNLPEITGGLTLISGAKKSSNDVIYQVTGNGTLKNCPHFVCIVAGTLITLSDGSKKPIEDITYNDELLVWDFYNSCFTSAKPSWIKVKQTATEYNRVTFSDGTVIGFVGEGGDNGYHRIFNREAGAFTHTGTVDTPNGTHTFCEDTSTPTVAKQEIVHETVDFYNVITDKHFNLFANGILTSCRLSNLYEIQDMKYIGERLMSDEDVDTYFSKLEPIKKR